MITAVSGVLGDIRGAGADTGGCGERVEGIQAAGGAAQGRALALGAPRSGGVAQPSEKGKRLGYRLRAMIPGRSFCPTESIRSGELTNHPPEGV